MTGKVVKILPSAYEIITSNNQKISVLAKGKLKLKTKIMLGDNVEVENGILCKILPQKNKLIRPECANIDTIVIIIASTPKPDFRMIDMLIAVCLKQKINFEICINKDDLSEKDFVKNINSQYSHLCPINVVSALYGKGINELKQKLCGIVAFAGQSGVGKTTLVNKLFGLNLREGNLSEKLSRGKNTTTQSYFHLADNGNIVIDTPGFSFLDYQKIGITIEDLKNSYPELKNSNCKYSACNHVGEDGCSVDKLACEGKINANRLERYRYNYKKLEEINKRKYK